MYFPRTAEYALRAIAHLARLPEGQGARAQELSEAADIPSPYLSKILRKLVLAGLLKSKKGHGGGFVLARPAKLIRFLDVLGASDYETNPASCAFGWGECDPNHPCPLHPSWAQLREGFLDWAASMTMADVQAAPYLPREVASAPRGSQARAGHADATEWRDTAGDRRRAVREARPSAGARRGAAKKTPKGAGRSAKGAGKPARRPAD